MKETEQLDIRELEKLRYAAMAKTYYDMHIELDKNMLNWSTLALAGLVALGFRGDLAFPFLWLLSLAAFAVACVLIRKAIKASADEHQRLLDTENFINSLYVPSEAEIKTVDAKLEAKNRRIRELNQNALRMFYLALGFAVLFVVVTVFC
jgi:divalent metal cation (Fe/Co/Zn/Cd) transporter